MRCSACGGLNVDNAAYCRNCGRDLRGAQNTRSYVPPSQQSVQQGVPRSPYPISQPVQTGQMPVQRPPVVPPRGQRSAQNPGTVIPQNVQPPVTTERRTQNRRATAAPIVQPVVEETTKPAAAQPQVTFPPQTVAHLQALVSGAQNYSLLSDDEIYGRKRVVRVTYLRCPAWQQMATLFKILQECKEDRASKFDTVIIQGFLEPESSLYNFTNGQLIYDRNVRLGSQVLNRYQLETGNGFSSDALRIVLTEVAK